MEDTQELLPNRDNAWMQERHVPALSRQIWQLTHLVSAATNGLSACLSLNSLLREARTQRRNDHVEIYMSSMLHSRASLGTYASAINELRLLMPKTLIDHTKDEVRRQAYSALLVAAYNTRRIMEFIEDVESFVVADRMTTNDEEQVEGVGWPQCVELGALKALCTDLMRNRDQGVKPMGIGWKEGAKAWLDLLDP
ncbi:hypothetical protein LTR36_003725 [Oleoguttula mirabilis]|uniref:Uncharacterized protein n=1 Tax=Oleoguttula mirabilis TaxID=1507867 RepID=A0AAV9JJU2_9PEZI|nr:hypothetical protein LTR36_003725 [Oleoguttula mirabilis]